MEKKPAIAVVGTFDSKGEEHLFLKERIEARGFRALTVNVGTKGPSSFIPDLDLFQNDGTTKAKSRDEAIQATLERGRNLLLDLHARGKIAGIISAGGGTGTHLATGIMRALPLGVPKVMVSTVASRDMKHTVGTKDITMMHSVADILGINSLLGKILDKAAGAVCGMVESSWTPAAEKKRVGLTMFGFITPAAEAAKKTLESLGYEVVAFHANGTGGMAMEELAEEGWFDGILDLATHELADELKQGYCKGIGPARLAPKGIPRLVVPGGLDCAVLEFTRDSIPPEYRDRKIFFYDFRSAIRLDQEETRLLARQLAGKVNHAPNEVKVLVPSGGWSEADQERGPLYDPFISGEFMRQLREAMDPAIQIREADLHINDPAFADLAARMMDEMIREKALDKLEELHEKQDR